MLSFQMCAKVPEYNGRGSLRGGGGPLEVEDRVVWSGGSRIYFLDEVNSKWERDANNCESGATLAVCGGRLLALGGYDGKVYFKEVKELRGKRWSNYSHMLVGCAGPCVISISGGGMVVMGGIGDGDKPLSDVQVFDGETQAWHRGPPLPQPCRGMSAVIHESQIFVMGGWGMDRAVWSTNVLDLQSIWRKLPDVPFMYSCVCVADGMLLAIGGAEDWDGLIETAATCGFCKDDQKWIHIGDLPFASSWVDTLLLSGGKLLVIDGYSQQVVKITVEGTAQLFPIAPHPPTPDEICVSKQDPITTEPLSPKVSAILDNYNYITFKQLRIVKLIFYGTPRAGKTTLRKQLLRHVEGERLQSCCNFEPSTNIAEVCDPIFVERILMTNEHDSEWKWAVQKLDDIAKALLQCLDNKQLQLENKSSNLQEASVNGNAIRNDVQQKPSVELQQSAEMQNFGAHNISQHVLVEDTSDHTEITETVHNKSMITGLNIKELFLNAVKTGQWAEVVSALNIDKATFLQIIDGGGQPSFQEIFPLLISGPSVTLLIFKLTDDLETLYPVQYQPESESEGPKAWKDHYIVKDIVSHALSSFVSQKETSASVPCKILLVGTHKDELEVSQDPHGDKECNKEGKILSIARQLHGWLHQSKAFESIHVRSIEDLITGIDNYDEKGIVSIRKKIEETISQLDSQDIPAPWLVFDFVLRKHAKLKLLCKVGKSDCNKIASTCGVKDDEVDVVLHYLHYVAGTLLYYSDIPTLNQHVIIDFQLIFDSISKIIIQYFDDNSVHGPHMKHKDLFKLKGQLNASVLKDVEGCLKVDELISLLQHRHIISEMEEANMFFMPSVLPKVELSYNHSSNSSTFLVLFDHGYCPVGLFCAATTGLIVAHKWEINNGELQFRNKINFYCNCSGKSYNVILSAFSAHYEVRLMEEETIIGEALPRVKYMIYHHINNAFAKVCKDMKYPTPSYGFYCPNNCKNYSDSYLQYRHPAFTFSVEEMKCCYSGTPSPLTEKHKQWFLTDAECNDPLSACSLKNLMNDIASKIPAKWRSVGIQLELSSKTLDGIQSENAGKPQACLDSFEQVLSTWKRKGPKPYTWNTIIDVLKTHVVGELALAIELEAKYLRSMQ